MEKDRKELVEKFDKWLNTNPRKQLISSQCANIAEEYTTKLMSKQIQIVNIDKSILDYFKMMMDFDNESQEYRDVTEQEFKDKMTESLNCGPATKEIVWVDKSK